ncbi:hypothetical protein B0H13DRAFT_1882409 [Mycena leptocephala]|nr:hypothetical protein B0H13DRAFT_1882409 [Mycena leptocephala]
MPAGVRPSTPRVAWVRVHPQTGVFLLAQMIPTVLCPHILPLLNRFSSAVTTISDFSSIRLGDSRGGICRLVSGPPRPVLRGYFPVASSLFSTVSPRPSPPSWIFCQYAQGIPVEEYAGRLPRRRQSHHHRRSRSACNGGRGSIDLEARRHAPPPRPLAVSTLSHTLRLAGALAKGTQAVTSTATAYAHAYAHGQKKEGGRRHGEVEEGEEEEGIIAARWDEVEDSGTTSLQYELFTTRCAGKATRVLVFPYTFESWAQRGWMGLTTNYCTPRTHTRTRRLLTLTYAAGVQLWDASAIGGIEEVLNLRIPDRAGKLRSSVDTLWAVKGVSSVVTVKQDGEVHHQKCKDHLPLVA